MWFPICICIFSKRKSTAVQLIGLVRRPHHRSRSNVKPERLSCYFPAVELFRCHISCNFHVSLRWLQILPERHDFDIVITEVSQSLVHLFLSFSETEHDRRLRHDIRTEFLCSLKNSQGLGVPRPSVPHSGSKPLHSLNVVSENLHPCMYHLLHQVKTTLEISNKRLYSDPTALKLPNRSHNVASTLVWQIISVNHGNDHIIQAPLPHSLTQLSRLIGIWWSWSSRCRNRTKSATSCACVAHDHHRRSSTRPTFTNIWTSCFLADCCQSQILHSGLEFLVSLTSCVSEIRVGHFQPLRLSYRSRLQTRWPRTVHKIFQCESVRRN
mmetsp:Transcript_9982/g.27951  ORF Transcript_9982/g.27951 Transcript_9982/m.27951 type:complete len:325 (+) Transcript_9982:177-1151(+)